MNRMVDQNQDLPWIKITAYMTNFLLIAVISIYFVKLLNTIFLICVHPEAFSHYKNNLYYYLFMIVIWCYNINNLWRFIDGLEG